MKKVACPLYSEKKAIENRNVILQEAAKQSAILGLKLGVKSLNDTGDKQ